MAQQFRELAVLAEDKSQFPTPTSDGPFSPVTQRQGKDWLCSVPPGSRKMCFDLQTVDTGLEPLRKLFKPPVLPTLEDQMWMGGSRNGGQVKPQRIPGGYHCGPQGATQTCRWGVN